jgi:transposase
MTSVPVFVGLDYADSGVQVCVLNAAGEQLGNRLCPNDWRAIRRYVAPLGRPAGVAVEVGTGAAHLADELRGRANWPVQLAHPGFVRRMKQNPDKTDYADSRVLADLQRVGYLPPVWLAPAALRELRRLVRYRQELVDLRRAAKLRVSALLRDHRIQRPPGKTWTQGWTRWLATVVLPEHSRWLVDRHVWQIRLLGRELGLVERRLAQAVADDPLVTRLRTLRGIGLVTACVLRAEIGDFGRFRTGKQLARFCGLTPRNVSSGQRQADAGLIRAGNPVLRATVIEAAHRLRRLDPRWRALAERLDRAGKPRCVTAAAVGNRWLRWLFYEMQRPTA